MADICFMIIHVTGALSFDEFLMFLDLMCHGNLDDRISWLFKLYDTNRDGVVSRDEMFRVQEAVMSMMTMAEDPHQIYNRSIIIFKNY